MEQFYGTKCSQHYILLYIYITEDGERLCSECATLTNKPYISIPTFIAIKLGELKKIAEDYEALQNQLENLKNTAEKYRQNSTQLFENTVCLPIDSYIKNISDCSDNLCQTHTLEKVQVSLEDALKYNNIQEAVLAYDKIEKLKANSVKIGQTINNIGADYKQKTSNELLTSFFEKIAKIRNKVAAELMIEKPKLVHEPRNNKFKLMGIDVVDIAHIDLETLDQLNGSHVKLIKGDKSGGRKNEYATDLTAPNRRDVNIYCTPKKCNAKNTRIRSIKTRSMQKRRK